MDTILLGLKILMFSMAGWYILKLIKGYNDIFYGVIVPFYGIFGIISIYSINFRLPLIFLIGILGGGILNKIFAILDNRLKLNINVLWFGIFNLINTYLLNDLFERVIMKSSYQSLTFLFVFGLSLSCIDIALSLRKLL